MLLLVPLTWSHRWDSCVLFTCLLWTVMVRGAETHLKPMLLAVGAGLGVGDTFSVVLDHLMADELSISH